jgi:ABC-2 type transport system permease protein
MMSQGSISFAHMANWWPPAWLALHAIENTTSMVTVAATLGNVALGIALCTMVSHVFSKGYGKILTTFGESSSIKATSKTQRRTKQGQNAFRERNVFFSLFSREIRLMNREPMFFLNGPFVILLIPLILILTFITRRNAILNLALNLRTYLFADSAAYLIPAGFCVFLASSTSITCTSFSRDAKSLYFLKSMPLLPRSIIMAKLAHGLVFAALGIAIGTLSSALLLKIESVDMLIALVLAMLGSLCLNLAGLVIDTFWPRLSWENPISALKQNPNSVIMILGTMGLIAGLGILSRALPAGKYFCAILYGILFSVASGVLWFVLSNYGVKKFRRMEP